MTHHLPASFHMGQGMTEHEAMALANNDDCECVQQQNDDESGADDGRKNQD